MNSADVVTYWLDSAENDRSSALDSFSQKHFDWAFFQWHIAIEKLLKGIIAKNSNTTPFTHDLVRLAELTKIQIPENYLTILEEANTYNINARYDDFKRSFYHKVIKPDYYQLWHNNCQEIYQWLKQQV